MCLTNFVSSQTYFFLFYLRPPWPCKILQCALIFSSSLFLMWSQYPYITDGTSQCPLPHCRSPHLLLGITGISLDLTSWLYPFPLEFRTPSSTGQESHPITFISWAISVYLFLSQIKSKCLEWHPLFYTPICCPYPHPWACSGAPTPSMAFHISIHLFQ